MSAGEVKGDGVYDAAMRGDKLRQGANDETNVPERWYGASGKERNEEMTCDLRQEQGQSLTVTKEKLNDETRSRDVTICGQNKKEDEGRIREENKERGEEMSSSNEWDGIKDREPELLQDSQVSLNQDLIPKDHIKSRKFNVKRAMGALTAGQLTEITRGIQILNFNIRGLRTKYKKESLKEMAHQLKFGVAIITETHLLDDEADALVIPGYEVLHRDGHSRQKGGVLILVHENIACRKLTGLLPLPRPLDSCSCILYPTKEESYGIRLTGLYVPPSAEATPEMMTKVTQPCAEDAKGKLSQVIIGDLNPNTWKGGHKGRYIEWLSEAGLWELSDPDLPTFENNTVIDKFLLCPGEEVPEGWFITTQSGSQGWNAEEEGDEMLHYPAITFPNRWVADHHPVMLGLMGQEEESEGGTEERYKLRIKDFTKEKWEEKNEEMLTFLEEQADQWKNAHQTNNVNRYWDLLVAGIRRILGSPQPKGDKNKKQVQEQSPFQDFCRRNVRHPEYSVLINSILAQDREGATAIMQRMTRDGWRRYLEETRSTDTSAFFLYIARMEGRKPRAREYPCRAPLLDVEGNRHFKAAEKCDLLADFFASRLNDQQHDERQGRRLHQKKDIGPK